MNKENCALKLVDETTLTNLCSWIIFTLKIHIFKKDYLLL